MDLMKYLSHITTVPGTSGYEAQVAEEFAKLFAPFCDEVTVDKTQSMIGVKRGKGNGPRVMLCAHIDEVGLMPFGLLLDLWECHKQFNGISKPKREHFIDDIIPDGI